mmetsp:Transcript_26978/g.52084  ORF Transcript_26978/g.52084 Transcript_26978/m.52084 type:complete len:139 (+) Transcript_26978:147-563(+)
MFRKLLVLYNSEEGARECSHACPTVTHASNQANAARVSFKKDNTSIFSHHAIPANELQRFGVLSDQRPVGFDGQGASTIHNGHPTPDEVRIRLLCLRLGAPLVLADYDFGDWIKEVHVLAPMRADLTSDLTARIHVDM